MALKDANTEHGWKEKNEHSKNEGAIVEPHPKTKRNRYGETYPGSNHHIVSGDPKLSGAICAPE